MILLRLLSQTVLLALGQIWANKVRSLLTTLGIVIGVAAVIATVAAVTGLRVYVLNEFETFGAKKVFLWGRVPESLDNKVSWRSVSLTIDELNAIAERCPSISKITPMWMGFYEVRNGKVTKPGIEVVGVWPQWHEIENRSVTMGRPLSRIDGEQALNVCVVNEDAIDELMLPRDPTGHDILVKGRKFKIIGVLETKALGPMFGGGDNNRTELYIPLETARNLRPKPFGRVSYAIAEMTDPDKVDDVRAEIGFVLRKMRGLDPEWEDTWGIEVMQKFVDQFKAMAAGITAVAGGIVAISLLVGGIGIMNIMLVSVSERTREIGLRKAVGAKPTVILAQFLVEAVVLCMAGAAVGLIGGQGLVLAIKMIPGAVLGHATIPLWSVALSAGFSVAIGVTFGMFPAIKAARLNPIDALRHE
jgi:putative ABC transport system permease protein